MNQYDQLKTVVQAKLQESGQLDGAKAQIRAQLYMLLNDRNELFPTASSLSSKSSPVQKSNFIIDELVREYLAFNGLQNTLSVFESGIISVKWIF